MKFLKRFIFRNKKALAFQPASHYILMERTAEALKEGSIIKKALSTHKNIAAWGSNAPDLGMIQKGELVGNSPWSSRFHYHKIGDFVSELLKAALESNDLKQIAFAAGWATHICGDLGCHGIFVNPECGVYMDNTEGRALHMKLEKAAEPCVWVDFGGYDESDYKPELPQKFSNIDELPFSLIMDTCQKVFGSAPSISDMKKWGLALQTGLKTGVGYKYSNYNEAKTLLNENERYERLKKGFFSAVSMLVNLFEQAESGDFNGFKNRWNLDVGRSDSPISNIKVAITTGTKFGAGTDDDIFLGFELKDGNTVEWKLDNGKFGGLGVNDFEAGNTDKFYLYVDKNSSHISPESIKKVYIRKQIFKLSIGHDWYVENIKLYLNGELALNEDLKLWMKNKVNKWEIDVDFNHIDGTPDELDPDPFQF